ncbi:MAG: hypothetical protein ACREIT_08450 [Tepidisphaeraceae bacterium]
MSTAFVSFTHRPYAASALVALGLALLGAHGCAKGGASTSAPPETHAPATQTSAQSDPIERGDFDVFRTTPAPQAPLPVKEGKPPLTYLVEADAPIRVVDLTANRVLVSDVVPARTIIRIDDTVGVRIGNRDVLSGRLSPDHRYGIFIDPIGLEFDRNQVIVPPRRAPRPTKDRAAPEVP